jgi:hypothetical protein
MEEIFETLREQIKGDFDQNNIIITGKPLTKEYIRFFNEPKKQYELTIKNCLQWKI